MPPSNSTELAQGALPVPKRKSNKKKKNARVQVNGDILQAQEHEREPPIETGDEEGPGDGSGQSTVNTPVDARFAETARPPTNGHDEVALNGHVETTSIQPTAGSGGSVSLASNASDTTDASVRFEEMSRERELLRLEVEQLRKSLEDIQVSHMEEVSTLKTQHAEEVSSVQAKLAREVSTIKGEHENEVTTIRAELEEAESAKEQAETSYQQLLGKINTIKASLGERLKADKEELAEAAEREEALQSQNQDLKGRIQFFEGEVKRLEQESSEFSSDLLSLRNRHNISQQNWINEREDLIQQTRQLKDEAEAAKEAMGDWEVLAMEERSMREGLAERVRDLDEQFEAQRDAYEVAVAERDGHAQSMGGLQRALQEVQEARKRELREMVESYEDQLKALKTIVQDLDARAVEAEASKNAQQAELARLLPYEKEVKEKNLLIGKLRHEAIVLNDHLTKALRFLKKAKPEDNIDRQIVTNHFLHFLALDRSDPKKFQILQLIAALLNWTEEQKEQAGLARPGASSSTLRLPMSPFHRTPSTPSLSSEFFTEPTGSKDSLADLWTGFLERSAEEGSTKDSRSGSVSSSAHGAPRPDTRGEGSSRG